jgi:hypothetical protein
MSLFLFLPSVSVSASFPLPPYPHAYIARHAHAQNAPQFGSSPGNNPNRNPNCGRQALVKGPSGQVQVTIVDMCPGCGYGSLDLSPAAFSHIAQLSQGRVHISWEWV